ncbi:MAG: SMP-30/gluconolaconase/LRE domain protein [Phycisphaeraceae bacterium]|nr:SMP-30/gluconolaconase/LRE domain protein [Phycisphaeraceae bacterium]
MPHAAELIVDANAHLGEGPIWDSRRNVLIWLDILDRKIHHYDPASDRDESVEVAFRPTAAVLRRSGGLMLATDEGLGHFDLDTGRFDPWADPESDIPANRFNDGKCDPAGRFWAGTMQFHAQGDVGALYVLDTDRSVRRVFDGVTCSNGIAWSADHSTMYYIDSLKRTVDAFDYDLDSGAVSNRRTLVKIPEGFPDGMTLDTDGNLWVAVFDGFRIACFEPRNGGQVDQVDVPVPQVTACWFGGEDLRDLFITTARENMDNATFQEHPRSGGLYRARPGATGLVADQYAG